jgi:hypothetical protein
MSAATASAPPLTADKAVIRTYLDGLYGTADTGYLSLFRAPDNRTDWVSAHDRERAAALLAQRCDAGHNVYHGMGLYRAPLGGARRGTADDVIALPGLFMDLDLYSPGAHTETALPGTVDDVVNLLTEFPLPPSLLIDSGHGLYAHWVFREVLTLDDARERVRVAVALRRLQGEIQRLGRAHGWKFDSTADLARVLRPPGVVNRKTEPVLTRVLHEGGDRYLLEEIEDVLPDDERSRMQASSDQPAWVTLDPILKDCPFLAHCRDDAKTLPEPQWHSMLTVVSLCDDGERAAHELSRDYPGYTRQETQGKYERARLANKPVRCETVQQRYGGEWCATCAQRGRITSPIQLGYPRVYSSGRNDASAQANDDASSRGAARLVVQSLRDVTSQPVAWDWLRWLARGKFHLLGGYAGDGKSTLLAALAAIGSRGGKWPDGTPVPRVMRTLFLLGEDSAADTLHPRLELHHADMDQIFYIETVLDEHGRERFFNIGKHLDLLEAEVVERNIDWIVIDPLTTIMPGTDRNAEGDTRDALTPLIKLAQRRNVAITGVAHVGKSGDGRRAAQKILGATAFHALARVVWMVAPDEDERMVLGVVKSNLAIKPDSLVWTREEDGPIQWKGKSERSVEDLLANAPKASPRADAEGFLRELLSKGAMTASGVEDRAKAAGITRATLRRAAEAIPVKKWKASGTHGLWYWSLPDGQPRHADPSAEPDESNLLTPKDAQVSKLLGANLLTGVESEHLHATTPIFSNGHASTPDHFMEGAQLAHHENPRGEQVTLVHDAAAEGGAQSKASAEEEVERVAALLRAFTVEDLAGFRAEVDDAPDDDPLAAIDRAALDLLDRETVKGGPSAQATRHRL